MRWIAVTFLLFSLWTSTHVARAEHGEAERPLLRPARDVAVTYRVSNPAAPRDAPPLEQRTHWLAAAQTMRIDPPTPGLYVIIDYLARRMNVVREAERSVIEMAAPGGMAGLTGDPGAQPYMRRGDDTVAGMGCTNWETTDRTGQRTLACITADGVLLRVVAGGQTLATAVSVQYAPQDASLFRVPSDYAHQKAGAAQ
jgi:hypothetical protein